MMAECCCRRRLRSLRTRHFSPSERARATLAAKPVEAEKRGKGKKGKKKKKGGGSGGAGPSQEHEAASEAAAAKLLETLHEERIRYGITAETRASAAAARAKAEAA
ncbi:hypothetical protein EMIHUDRAFT_237434 [Emiliania huxleyi CCMP1516]|uniref:Uncharacterized protein n=2 Tax=Emiliania huxleyi TaxID=2903 RepID=A0A0D3JQ69_EMIH1|nr:hypothetical protein EMIHUDRAFT_237434 [Emiliania huxleyi CCMP1516]EOD25654.1 hypothetical protein EMIHUDRAFT_237434 [Emiliania huxleyi CCMP1516]|eukprot:XP_005778083.1 hypothetical protein EMIHUDRAFT_237434 [Emiliania huxleyi CCMP1516]